MAGQKGKRRGRYKPRVEPIDDEEAYTARVEALAADYATRCTVKDAAERQDSALTLARLVVHLEALSAREARGELTVDESKSMVSLSREIRNWKVTMGLLGEGSLEDPDEEEL